MTKRTWRFWWSREYTHNELMQESRWILFIVGGLSIIWGGMSYYVTNIGFIQMSYLTYILFGTACFIAGIARSYWFRFACICLFNCAYVVMTKISLASVILTIANIGFVYKMLKYRGKRSTNASDVAGPIK